MYVKESYTISSFLVRFELRDPRGTRGDGERQVARWLADGACVLIYVIIQDRGLARTARIRIRRKVAKVLTQHAMDSLRGGTCRPKLRWSLLGHRPCRDI